MADFRDVDQTVEAGLQLYEATVFLDLNNFALDDVADCIVLVDDGPGFRNRLLETEADLAFFGAHAENLDLDLLTNGQNFLRVLELAPGNLADVQQTVDTADVNKCTVIGETHDCAFHDVADLDLLPDFLHRLLTFLVQESLVREDSLASSRIDSGYLDLQSLAEEFGTVLNVSVRQLRQRNKAGHFFVRGNDTTVDLAHHLDFDDRLVFQSLIDFLPMDADFQLLSGKKDVPVAVVILEDFGLDVVSFVEHVGKRLSFFEVDLVDRNHTVLLDVQVDNDFLFANFEDLAVHELTASGESQLLVDLVHKVLHRHFLFKCLFTHV